jgi:hypothetical protein
MKDNDSDFEENDEDNSEFDYGDYDDDSELEY